MSDTDEQKASAVADAEDIDSLKVEEKEKLAAAEEAYEKKQAASANGSAPEDSGHPDQRHDRRGEKKMPWVPGVILIGLGVIFLLNNITGFSIDNWWALFIFIPAIGALAGRALGGVPCGLLCGFLCGGGLGLGARFAAAVVIIATAGSAEQREHQEEAEPDQRTLPLSARTGPDGPVRRLRSAHADGLRLGCAVRRRGGRPGGRAHQLHRGHEGPARRPAPG